MCTQKLLSAAVCLAWVTSTTVPGLAAEPPPALETKSANAKSMYRKGHRALSQSEWIKAYEAFGELERVQQRTKEATDAAIYWQAYALSRAGRTREARALVERLAKAYPDSPWRDDARHLGQRIRPHVEIEVSNEEDVMMALDALMASGSRRVVPVLQKVLAGKHSDKVKARALFVLSQIDATAADEALQRILDAPSSTTLKERAIRMIAVGGRSESLLRLDAVYERYPELRRSVVQAWLIGSRGDLLLRVAKGEKDRKLQRRIVEALGAISARKALVELYQSRTEVDVRRDVLRGLGIAGASKELGKIAMTDKSELMRLKAIKALGIAGGSDILRDIAESGKTTKDRAAAIRGLGIAGGKLNAKAIAELYLEGDAEIKSAALNALMICGGTEQLVELYKAESDPKTKRKLLRRIVTTGGDVTFDIIESDSRKGGE